MIFLGLKNIYSGNLRFFWKKYDYVVFFLQCLSETNSCVNSMKSWQPFESCAPYVICHHFKRDGNKYYNPNPNDIHVMCIHKVSTCYLFVTFEQLLIFDWQILDRYCMVLRWIWGYSYSRWTNQGEYYFNPISSRN